MERRGQGFGLGLIVCILGLVPLGCHQPQATVEPLSTVPMVRIRLLASVPRINLTAASPPTIQTAVDPPQHVDFPVGQSVPVMLTPTGWQVGSLRMGSGELLIAPDPDGTVSINGKAYHGQYRLIPASAGRFDVVNHVDVESYLKGVLAQEMMPDFHPEAYAAQAIVARTYAIYQARTAPPGRPWDLHTDDRSQVYGGIAAESPKSRAATDQTRGVVVAYGPPGQEKIFKAYFSSCCGGATQSATDAFNDPPSEPLRDQYIGPRCNIAAGNYHSRFNWGPIVIRKTELARRMRLFGKTRDRSEQRIKSIQRIDILRQNAAGRPVQFRIVDGDGKFYMLSGEELRWAVNTDASEGTALPSSFMTPVAEGNVIRFENGHGFGHGVGLCQWCAQAQAAQGISHSTIVPSAYPGSKLVKAY